MASYSIKIYLSVFTETYYAKTARDFDGNKWKTDRAWLLKMIETTLPVIIEYELKGKHQRFIDFLKLGMLFIRLMIAIIDQCVEKGDDSDPIFHAALGVLRHIVSRYRGVIMFKALLASNPSLYRFIDYINVNYHHILPNLRVNPTCVF